MSDSGDHDDRVRAFMLSRWRAGRDTLDIAKTLGYPEATIYAALPLIRARSKLASPHGDREHDSLCHDSRLARPENPSKPG